MAKHTPTPWRYEIYEGPHPDAQPRARIYCRIDEVGNESIIVDGLYPHDAAFIVRACNAHEPLLEAVRLDVVDGECFCHAGPESAGRHALGLGPGPCDYCVAKAAVALAEGREG